MERASVAQLIVHRSSSPDRHPVAVASDHQAAFKRQEVSVEIVVGLMGRLRWEVIAAAAARVMQAAV